MKISPTPRPFVIQSRGLKVTVKPTTNAIAYCAVAELEVPLPRGGSTAIAREIKVDKTTVSFALKLRGILASDPKLRAKWEPLLLRGVIGAQAVLKRLAKEAAAPAST